jgi:hypothetical protein
MRYDIAKQAELAPHVGYELTMMAATADRLLPRHHRPVTDTVVSNSLIESFLVHARLLDEFFGAKSRGPRNRDVRAKDFNPSWVRGYVLTADERDGIDGKVVHLAEDRVEGFPWWLGDILVRFVEVFEKFIGADEGRRQFFGATVSDAAQVAEIFRLAADIGDGVT